MLNVRSLSTDDGGLDKYLPANILNNGNSAFCFFHHANESCPRVSLGQALKFAISVCSLILLAVNSDVSGLDDDEPAAAAGAVSGSVSEKILS